MAGSVPTLDNGIHNAAKMTMTSKPASQGNHSFLFLIFDFRYSMRVHPLAILPYSTQMPEKIHLFKRQIFLLNFEII
jgi:hypothetical protein